MITLETAPWVLRPEVKATLPVVGPTSTVGIADADFIAEGYYSVVAFETAKKEFQGNSYEALIIHLQPVEGGSKVQLNLRKGLSHVVYDGGREEQRITGNWLDQLPAIATGTKWGACVSYRANCPVTDTGIKPIKLDFVQIP
ncbi:MAG: hypothetical protein HUJ75_06600 [Parasporobacterium sp.]|nr:hypothetical protein [Parasporobacterium sp.]